MRSRYGFRARLFSRPRATTNKKKEKKETKTIGGGGGGVFLSTFTMSSASSSGSKGVVVIAFPFLYRKMVQKSYALLEPSKIIRFVKSV